jgi:hypothetical protein
MAIQGVILQEQTARASENIFNPFLTLNTPNTYTITDGVGVAEISNTDEFFLTGEGCMKIRFLVGGGQQVSFNAGAYKTDSVIKSTGLHFIQYAVYKNNPTADVNLTVNVLINETFSSNRQIGQNIYSASGFIDDNWNIYYQSFLANEGDIVSLTWSADSDDETAIIYMDNFKLERANQNIFAPTIYSNPTFLINKWSRVYDFTNTQLLFEDTAINFSLFEGTFESNCGSEILVEGVGFKPTRLNSFFTVNANFLAKVPSGTTPHIDAQLNINGTTYYGDCKFLQKPVDGFEYVNFSFQIPCNAEFLEFEGAIELIARGNDIEISKRNLTISETVNSN